jgi:4-hydroxy-3-polyprenylbenzoate decarboxylase
MEITLAITGASGAVYARRLLHHLSIDPAVSRINLISSSAGIRVILEELKLESLNFRTLPEALLGKPCDKVDPLNNNDIGARVASGSSPVNAMVVIPCSMGTLGSLAHGVSRDLIQRAADVVLKERRRLILVTRDTPLNLIHIENMRLLTLAGAIIFPACLAFYPNPHSLEDAIDQFVFRVMASLGLPPPGMYHWSGNS